jgi:hypothetical protein
MATAQQPKGNKRTTAKMTAQMAAMADPLADLTTDTTTPENAPETNKEVKAEKPAPTPDQPKEEPKAEAKGDEQPEQEQPTQEEEPANGDDKQPEQTPPARNEDRDDKRFLAISDASCLTALQRAFGFGKAALHLELAVSLSIFAYSDTGADLITKRHVMSIYGEAGFDVNPNGEDYKTISRRINAAAKLYNTLGGRPEIDRILEGTTEDLAIEMLKNHLTQEYNFSGINAVLAAAGSPVPQYNTPERAAARAQGQQPPTTPAQAQEPTSTQAGGEPGAALPQGHVAAGGTNEQGMPLTAEGTVDKRVKPEGGESIATQEARGEITKEEGDAQAGKEPSAEDKATASVLAEKMEARTTDRRMNRRSTDSPDAIIFTTDNIHVALPHDISMQEVKDLAFQLMAFAAEMQADEEAAKQKHSLASLQASRQQDRRHTDRRMAAH